MSQQGPVIFNGRYELHRRLGRGGMAEVYLARDQMLDRPVAVKVLFPALATDPGFVERFRREAQSAAGLNHPNIVGVYDWGEANGTYFIVMEYVEGESLAEQIQRETRLHPDRAAEIGSDIASALGYAHRNGGVIHRDVKPGNVLITREGEVKVADFGIARAISDSSDQNLTKTGSVMGTATYFSPEQARGAAIDPRSDIYSLGCVLYEMIIGRPPFSGENAVAIAYKHVQEAPVPPRRIDPALPETLEAIILKCLAKNPANRYPSAQDMRADLRRYLDGARIMAEPVLAPPIDPGATGLMAPTGYMQPTSTIAPTRYGGDSYGDNGYGDYDDYDGYDDEEPKRSKAFLPVLVLLVLVLGGVLFLLARTLGGGDDDGGTANIKVPMVIDMPQAQAEAAIRALNLEPKVEQGNSDKAPGIVYKQEPGANAKLEEGGEVKIFVSKGAEQFVVPDVTNQLQADAQALIQAVPNAGFIAQVKDEASDTVEEGKVIRTEPAANAQAPKGATITMIVSSGANAVPIPNVVNQPEATATNTLTTAGFEVEVIDAADPRVPAGTVISQDRTGTAAPGTIITITVSTGSGNVNVPDVRGRSEQSARALLADFVVEVTYEPTLNPNDNDKVQQQNPQGGQQAAKGSTVRLIISRFTPTSTTQNGGN